MKFLIKTFCVFIAVVMAFTMVVSAFAADSKSAEVYPQVYVPGVASTKLYADKDDPDSAMGLLSVEALLENIKRDVLPAFLVYAADNDGEKLGQTIADFINTSFAEWYNEADGSAQGNAGARFEYPSPSSVRNSEKIRFSYDWRGDPVEIAAELDKYINYVLECTGKDKVALSAHSLGSVIILSYISIYGDDKVMGVVFDTPAIDGLTSVGELFTDKTKFDAEGVATIFKMILGTTEYEELLSSIIDIFTMAGINGSISDFLNNAYDEIGPALMRETLLPLFGCWCSVWAMIPDDYINEAMTFAFDGYFSDEAHAPLKTKVESYNELVRKNKRQTLLELDENARVAVIARYGYNSIPMTEEWTMISDNVIETQNSSLGATTAPLGTSFSEEYLKGKDMKYISPDKTIDASTCLFPEKTWFLKDSSHGETRLTSNYYSKLLFGAEEATCENSGLSRFLIYDRENDVVLDDNSEPVKEEKLTVFRRVFNFIKALINQLLELFKK